MEQSLFIGRKLGSRAKNWLKNNAVDFEEHPLIQIEFVQPKSLKKDFVRDTRRQFVITSQWAAKWLSDNFSRVRYSVNDCVFCISEKQEKILRTFTNQVFVSENQNAASLVQLLFQKNTNETVVFLRGNKSLDIVPSKLKLKGVRFKEWEVYRNLPQKIKTDKVFDAFLFFSPSGVENFVEGGQIIPQASKIITIGNTTAKKARQLFKNEVFVSGEQEEFAFIKFAVDLLKYMEVKA